MSELDEFHYGIRKRILDLQLKGLRELNRVVNVSGKTRRRMHWELTCGPHEKIVVLTSSELFYRNSSFVRILDVTNWFPDNIPSQEDWERVVSALIDESAEVDYYMTRNGLRLRDAVDAGDVCKACGRSRGDDETDVCMECPPEEF